MARKSAAFSQAATDAYGKAARKPAGWMLETRLAEPSDFVPTGHEGPSSPPPEASSQGRKSITKKLNISDTLIEAMQDFMSDGGMSYVLLLDTNTGKAREREAVSGLRCRIGPRSVTWLYYRDKLDGKK
jgi:hypothetical protein